MLFVYKINELTFIENCVINFSQTVSLHWVSGIDFSHIWLTWSALPSVELPSVGDLLASWLWLPWQAIYKTYCLKIIQKFYVHVHMYVPGGILRSNFLSFISFWKGSWGKEILTLIIKAQFPPTSWVQFPFLPAVWAQFPRHQIIVWFAHQKSLRLTGLI